jgi:DNA-binding NarL/FixJ family response regulator
MKTESLSSRELECLRLLSKGLSVLEISEVLKLSPRTVENYISNIKAKWNYSKATELIYQAAKRGLV